MPSTSTSRLDGLTTSVAIKPACVCATTANIALAGLQAIDDITVGDGYRVLVKDQTDASENGIWNASASDWARALDFDGSRDAVGGTLVTVIQGTAHANSYWKVSGVSVSIDIGTDDIAFETASASTADTQSFNANGTGTYATTTAAILRQQIRLYDYLSPSQRTLAEAAFDNAAATAPDVAAAAQAAINDAAGFDVNLPRRMRIALAAQVSRIPTVATYGGQYATGMKLIGPGSGLCKIESRVATYPIKCDTAASNLFQRDIILHGFRLNGQHASAAGGSGIYMQRAYNAHLDDVYLEYFDADGLYIPIIINDQDGSNQIVMDRCRFYGCLRWGFNVDPAAGSNDLSFLTIANTGFTACGTSVIKTITGVTQANPGVVTTSAAHGRTTGDKVYLFGMTGMTELNHTLVTATVLSPTTFSIGVNTSGYVAYTSGGEMMPRIPTSGAIRGRWGMAHIRDSYVTESQNVALFLNDGAAPYRTLVQNFTVENNTGVGILIHSSDGFTGKDLDLRSNNNVAKSHSHVLIDASVSVVANVVIERTSVKTSSGCSPYRAFEVIDASNLSDLKITGSRWNDYDYPGQDRFGAGVWKAPLPMIEDQNRPLFQPTGYNKLTTTSTSTDYSPDVRKYERHLVQLSTAFNGTITINGPTASNIVGTALAGRRLDLTINNPSTKAATLAVGGSLDAVGAPGSIAAGSRAMVTWQYDSALGWLRTTAWTTV